MNKNSRKLIFGTANKRQRYPIRKLTICAANVLLDTTLLFGAGQTVQADTTGQESEQKEETVQLNKDETAKETQSTSVGDASSTNSKVTKDVSTSEIDNKKTDDSQNVSGENKNQVTKANENITSESGRR